MGGLFTSRPWIQQGLRICCLDYKSQLQYTSVSVALGEPAPLPAVSSSNRSSAQLGYQALRQREACLFEKRLLQVGRLGGSGENPHHLLECRSPPQSPSWLAPQDPGALAVE